MKNTSSARFLFALILTCLCISASAQRIHRVTGGPGNGRPALEADVPALFLLPLPNGDIVLVSETYGFIRKIDHTTNVISALLGTGVKEFANDGTPIAEARVYNVRGMALAADGDIVYSDVDNKIRRVDFATGTVTVIAGGGSTIFGAFSGDGGSAVVAGLKSPERLVFDAAGNLYIGDLFNYRIRKISTTGIISTIAGNGSSTSNGNGGLATSAGIDPRGLAIDANGDLYFSEISTNTIRKITMSTGIISLFAGNGSPGSSGDGGPATSAAFSSPLALAISGDNLYIVDQQNNKIRKVILSTGVISTFAGSAGAAGFAGDGGAATSAKLNLPFDVRVDASGNVLIADYNNRRIRKVSAGVITTVGGNGGFAGDGLSAEVGAVFNPRAMVMNQAGDLIFADQSNNRIRKIDHTTGLLSTIAGIGSRGFSGDAGLATAAEMDFPYGLAIDATGNLFVTEYFGHRVRRIDGVSGIITTVAGNGSPGQAGDGGLAISANVASATGVAVDGDGNLYITDGNHKVRKVTASTGIITTIAGTGTAGFSGDGGLATAAQFNSPTAPVFDNDGNLYIADNINRRVRKIAPNGNISTIAGPDGSSDDGVLANTAFLSFVTSMYFDGTGLLIGHTGNVRRINFADNKITTIAGSGYQGYFGDGGPAKSAIVDFPYGLVADPQGVIYVADVSSHAIFKIPPRTQTQTITFNAIPAHAVGDVPFEITTAMASSSSGLPLTFVSSNTGVATILGNLVAIKGVGTTTITASQAGDVDFLPALVSPTQVLTVNKGIPALAFTSVASASMGSVIALKVEKGGSTGVMTFSIVSTTGKATLSGSSLTLGSRGTVTVRASIAADANYLATTKDQVITMSNPLPEIALTSPLTGKAGTNIPLVVDKGGSGGTVVFSVENLNGSATISGEQLTLVTPGQVRLKVTVAADANYAQTTLTQIFNISDANGVLVSATSQIFGMTTRGGTMDAGVLYKMNADFTGQTVLKNFEVATGGYSAVFGRPFLATDGYLYGITSSGGLHNGGTIYKYDPTAGTISAIFHFTSSTGYRSTGSLVQASDGMLYGLANQGGTSNSGTLYQFDPVTLVFTKKIDFNGELNGGGPNGGLVEATAGFLYGTTASGGTSFVGTLFKYEIATGTLTKLQDFSSTTGNRPNSDVVMAPNGKIYGVCTNGGANFSGSIFEFDPAGSTFTKKVDMDFNLHGTNGLGPLVVAGAKLYTMFSFANNNNGTIVEYVPGATTATKRFDFTSATGSSPFGRLELATNGKLYGASSFSGPGGGGAMIEFDPVTNTGVKKFDFNRPDGAQLFGGMCSLPDGRMIGMTASGGPTNAGTVFEYVPGATTYTKKADFDFSPNGAAPAGKPLVVGSKFYGLAGGGSASAGIFYEYDLVTGNYTKKLDLTFATGNGGIAALLHPNGKIYIVTTNGGLPEPSFGTIIEYNPVDGQATVVHQFTDFNVSGALPNSALIAKNGKIYGTGSGGSTSGGVIFEYNPSTDQYTLLYTGSNSLGSTPRSLVEAPDGMIYGIFLSGTANFNGGVFKLDPGSNTVTPIYSFTNGGFPRGNLVFAPNGKLYGLTGSGGTLNGQLYELTTDGATFTPKHDNEKFINDYGLKLSPSGNLMGYFTNGGTADLGYLYEYDVTANTHAKKLDFIGANGSVPTGELLVVKAEQTIDFKAIPVSQSDAAPFTLTATSSAGLDVQFTSSNPAVATVSGNTVTVLTAGVTVITANQPGNSTFAAAQPMTRLLVVKQAQTISFETVPDKTFGGGTFNLVATSTSGLTPTFTSLDNVVITVSGNAATIVGAGTVDIKAEQAGNDNFAAAAPLIKTVTVLKAAQTITFDAPSVKTLGDAPFPLVATSTSALAVGFSTGSDKLTIAGNTATMVKAGLVTVQAFQTGSVNYLVAANVEQSFCINPTKPTITVSTTNPDAPTLTSSNDAGNQWYLNGTTISGATAKTLAVTAAGSYTVKTKVDDCESAASNASVVVVTGVEEVFGSSMSIDPNPFELAVYVQFDSPNDEEVSIKVMDMMGRVVATQTGRTNRREEVQMVYASPGAYLIRATTTEKAFVGRAWKR